MRPRTVLIQPNGENWVAGKEDVTRLANIMPPHGLMMLAACLERRGFPCSIVDTFAHPATPSETVREALAGNPALVGFTATTASFLAGVDLARAIKAQRPGVKVLFGGVHATSLWPRLLAEYPAIDFIAVGEGEGTLLDLVEAGLEPGAGIPGLAHRAADGQVCYGGPRPLMKDLDALPFPSYDKLKGFPKAYPLPLFSYPRAPATTLITSRGCPFTCSYCDRSVFGSSFRAHSAEYLLDHLQFLRTRYGIRHVSIYDDNFTLRPERVAAFCEGLMASGLRMTFNCIGRAKSLDQPTLKLMKRAGCWMINLGVESGDQEVLAKHRSGSDAEALDRAIRDAKAAGIRVKGLFMMGFPGETEESIRKTIGFCMAKDFDEVNLTKFTPFPGAPVYAAAKASGRFEEDWNKMNCVNFVYVAEGFTRERLEYWYAQFYRTYYRRPQTLWRFASMTWKTPDSFLRFLRHLPKLMAVRTMMDQAVNEKS